jgi:anti-anti-sigma factor
LKYDIEYKDSILFVRLNGDLTKRRARYFNRDINRILKKYKIRYLVCNLHDLSDIDIVGIETLINIKCTIKINKGKMIICGMHSRIREYLKPLKITKMDTEFLAVEYLGA